MRNHLWNWQEHVVIVGQAYCDPCEPCKPCMDLHKQSKYQNQQTELQNPIEKNVVHKTMQQYYCIEYDTTNYANLYQPDYDTKSTGAKRMQDIAFL